MASILILYATIESHTARIADRMASRLRIRGHKVETYPLNKVSANVNAAFYDGVILGASIHYGRHPRHVHTFVRRHAAILKQRPTAFFSVSLSAGGPGAKPGVAEHYLETFLRRVDWQPSQTAVFAGALQYSRYGMFKKQMMRLIVGHAGGDTDTARDYMYTDWPAVERFADSFARRLPARA